MSQQTTTLFNFQVLAEFAEHLNNTLQNPRRISDEDYQDISQWLTNSDRRPQKQSEHSRREYVRRTFGFDKDEYNEPQLVNISPTYQRKRPVVTIPNIPRVVEFVHQINGHRGWDTTWENVRDRYYGILRADVIFLLKRCPVCLNNPSKRPKGQKQPEDQERPEDYQYPDPELV